MTGRKIEISEELRERFDEIEGDVKRIVEAYSGEETEIVIVRNRNAPAWEGWYVDGEIKYQNHQITRNFDGFLETINDAENPVIYRMGVELKDGEQFPDDIEDLDGYPDKIREV